MSRPRSELTKFILSLPLDLAAKDVVRKANQKGLKSTESNVQRVRAMARRAAKPAAKGKAAANASRQTTEKALPSRQPEGEGSWLSKSDFIRSRPPTETAAEVVEAAKVAGLMIQSQLVYRVRAERMASKTTAAAAPANPAAEAGDATAVRPVPAPTSSAG